MAGNHDHLLSRLTNNFLGLPIRKQYQWIYEGKIFLAMHGHQFDAFIARHPLVTAILGLSADSVKRHLFRAVRHLRKALEGCE